MTKLRIADLLASAPVDPEAHLDAERVAHYARADEALSPVTVFDTPEGLLLVDGYHRLAAARRRGATTIDAEVCLGSRAEALEHAIASAMTRGIARERAEAAIRRRSVHVDR